MKCAQSLLTYALALFVSLSGASVLANDPPVALCTDVTVSAGSGCQADASIDAGSYDPDGDPVTITQNPSGPYPLGTTPVTLRITDNGGLWAQCQATVTVVDDVPPEVDCNTDPLRLACDEPTDPAYTGQATVSDNCDPDPTLEYHDTKVTHLPGGPLLRTILRVWRGTDLYGNVGECVQPILIYDWQPPYFTFCPDDVTVSCEESTDPMHTGQATGADICNPDPDLWYTDELVPGQCPHEYLIQRTWHLNDGTGIPDITCLQVITVVDDTPPQITCPDNLTVECLTDVPAPDVGLVTAIDNCDPAPLVEFVGDEQTGICPIIVSRSYRATDVCGNEAVCVQTITVEDITDPVITAGPGPVTVECFEEIPAPDPGLIEAEDNCDADLLIEPAEDVVTSSQCPFTVLRTYRVSDDCDNSAIFEQVFTVDDLTDPICVAPEDQVIFQCEPEEICLPIEVSDNCLFPPAVTVTAGPGAIVDGQWCYTPTASTDFDVTIHVEDTCGNHCESSFHVDITINSRPGFVNCPAAPVSLAWGDSYQYDFEASDADAEQTLTFSLADDAPEGTSVNPATGALNWTTTWRNICNGPLNVIVADDCGAADTCRLEVCVYNDPPELVCPDDQAFCRNTPLWIQLEADDPDAGPFTLFYLLNGPTGVDVDANSGEISWAEPEPGQWEICVLVTDSAALCEGCSPENADTCCFTVSVYTLDLVIEKLHDQIQGQYTDVSIDFVHTGSNWPVAGFDFLLQYDASALSFVMAYEGQFFLDCEWEYLTYRFGASGNCGPGACPSGILRVVGMAEAGGGDVASHPDCYTNDGVPNPGPAASTSTELAVLRFLVSNDRTLECQFVPIRFVWYDCADNSLSSVTGDTLHIANLVFDYAGEIGDPPLMLWNDITGLDNSFPTLTGAPSPDCDVSDKAEPYRCAGFYNGGIDIVCADSIDAVGDINLNGIGYEVADAVMFTNYFLQGLAAFGSHAEGSIAASDVNRDGVPLSVADLVYLIRVVVGDALPYAKPTPVATVQANYSLEDGVLSVDQAVAIGAAALVVRGQVLPELVAAEMALSYTFDGTATRIIVTPPLDVTPMASCRGPILSGLTADLVSLEMATPDGAAVLAKNQPSHYRLSQNYPNPFNPSTTFEFALPVAGSYRLAIYNIQGQLVDLVEGRTDAPGVFHYEWDGSDHASGVYLYRLEAGEFSRTRKMLLLK